MPMGRQKPWKTQSRNLSLPSMRKGRLAASQTRAIAATPQKRRASRRWLMMPAPVGCMMHRPLYGQLSGTARLTTHLA